MPATGPRYPSKLTALSTKDTYTASKIASILDVTERSVLRWCQLGYLQRHTKNGKPVYKVNTKLHPAETLAEKPRTFSDQQLAGIHTAILENKEQAVMDLGSLVRGKTTKTRYEAFLKGLDQYREFVEYMIEITQ